MKKVALLIACSLIASCSTSVVTKYRSTSSAKSLTNSEVAILETRPSTWILSIDDEPMAGVWHWGGQTEVVATKVTPGEHVLMLREVTDRGSTRNPVALRVRVKAGRRYDVYPVSPTYTFHDGDVVRFTIEEQYSGASNG